MHSVAQQTLEPGYGYVRITSFSETTAEDVTQAVSRLKTRQSAAEFKGLVLDLRNNPGGVLEAGVAVADDFLDRGVIVTADGRTPDARFRMDATPGDLIDGAPLVVLVNGGSASASEIVAGALKDHGRALLVGRRTYGKGSVQTVMPLSRGGRGEAHDLALLHPLGGLHPRQGASFPTSLEEGPGEPPAELLSRVGDPAPRARCGRTPGARYARSTRVLLAQLAARAADAGPARALTKAFPYRARRRVSRYPARAMLAWLIDFVLHLDRHLVELLARYRPVDLPDPVRGDLRRDRAGRDARSCPGDSLLFAVGALRRWTPAAR